ncbi:MAG: phytoene desaturase family protein, partial [Acidimicrobiia bacterium]
MTFDVVIVGSGINSLVCAALLARAGKRVAVLERNDRLGGCIRTEELFPGFTHDVLSSWYPLFMASPAYQELGPDLHGAGLELVNTEMPTGVVTPDGSLVFTTSDEENIARLNALAQGEGHRYGAVMGHFFAENADLTFGLLGNEPWSRPVGKLLFREVRRRGLAGTAAFFGEALESCRAWVERDFRSPLTRALITPWVLHAGLGPDDAYSGLMGKVILGALGMAGLPVVKGGSARIVDAFREVIERHGGLVLTSMEVEAVEVEGGRARGARTTDGTVYRAELAVVCNVTPSQLYRRLLPESAVPSEVGAGVAAYRYGRAGMQIHYALSSPPEWSEPELSRTALLHLTPGLDGVSKAVNEAERGLL